MTSCSSAHPHLASLTNSRFLAVLGRRLGRSPRGFYRSTRFIGSGAPRRSEKQNILSRVNIPIVVFPTIRTSPLTNSEGHFLLIRSTLRAGFTSGCKSVHDKHITAIPLSLVFKLAAQLKQATIDYGFTQVAVTYHSFDIQIFQANYLVLVDKPGGYLVQEIFAAISNSGMNAGNTVLLYTPTLRTLALLAEPTLSHLQLAGVAVSVFSRAGLEALRGDRHVLDTDIDTDRVLSDRQRSDLHRAGHAHKVTATRVFADCDHFRHALNVTGPLELERTELGQFQQLAFSTEIILYVTLIQLIAYRLSLMAFFKAWILRSLVEEVFKRFVLSEQLLRMATGGGFAQPEALRLFQCRQLATERRIIKPLFSLLICLGSCLQRPVPHKAGMAKFNGQLPLLLSGRIEPEFIGALRDHITIILQWRGSNNGLRIAKRKSLALAPLRSPVEGAATLRNPVLVAGSYRERGRLI